jgi:hypothetical protein
MADQAKTKLPETPFPQFEKQAKSLMGSASVKFSADGTAVLTSPVPIEGKWTLDQRTVRLVPNDASLLKKVPFVGKEILFEVDPDFNNLTWKLESPFGPVEIVMTKTG